MKITYSVIAIIFSAFIFCCSSPSSKSPVQSKGETTNTQTQNDLPKMVIKSLDESNIDVHALKEKTILILFQPDCDHCEREAKEIRDNLPAFKEYTLYFISAGEIAAVQKFGETYDLLGQNNVVFALTTVDDVIRNFGGIPAPSVYIYTDQRLVKKFNGEVTIGRILQAI
jgi:thioredoxin-related protein